MFLAALKVYHKSLANVDFLHGSAESMLTVTNLLIGEFLLCYLQLQLELHCNVLCSETIDVILSNDMSAFCHGMQCLVSDKVCGRQSKQIKRSKVLRVQVLQTPSAQQMQLNSSKLAASPTASLASSASMQLDLSKTPIA